MIQSVLRNLARRQRNPYCAWSFQPFKQFAKRTRADRSFRFELFNRFRASVADDDLVPTSHQAARHVSSHPP